MLMVQQLQELFRLAHHFAQLHSQLCFGMEYMLVVPTMSPFNTYVQTS
eukprot:COSAG05_NODE_31_length_28416_cov_170.150652_16_plen_48_part_00